jgi:hypothetical protein
MPLTVSRRLRLALAAGLLASLAGFGGNAIATADPNVITRSGSTLMLHGHAYRFTGVNAYQLGTYWNSNLGCGGQLTDQQLDQFFASLRPDSVVRFWAFQALAVNRNTHKPDFTGLDRVFRAAERHGQRLIPVLSNQDGSCDDGHWRDIAWYSGAFTKAFDDNRRGVTPAPFTSWVTSIVSRYRSSRALGMWEPVNEPEATNCATGYRGNSCYAHHPPCPPGGAAALRHFFDTIGGQIKRLDPKHLLVSGVIGAGQCGTQGADYSMVHASRFVDVATYHDYGSDNVPVPGDRWNGMAVRLRQAEALAKPLISEEVGIRSSPNQDPGCVDPARRTALLTSKLHGQLAAGSRGFLPWTYAPAAEAGCRHDIGASDPMLVVLRRTPL